MNPVELAKSQKDGLDVLEDLDRIAHGGPTAMTPDDEIRLRWYGIYTQRPAGDGYFMVRTRIPGGELTPSGLRTLAGIARDFGRDLADVTVRQNIQFHWVRAANLPALLDRLHAAGLSTTESCGDCVRNIVGCPVSGVDADELYDTRSIVREVNDFFVDNRAFSNLPRKFKIAITGCVRHCTFPEVNDIGISPYRSTAGVAFRVRVGGGLSTSPRFSRDLGVAIGPADIVPVSAAIAEVFRDEGDRENRKRSRLKFLVETKDVPWFRDAVESRLGRTLEREPEPEPVRERDRVHLGIHPQRQEGLSYAGLSLVGGRTSGSALDRIADIAEQYGSDRIRTTNSQNVLLLDLPTSRVPELRRILESAGFDPGPSWVRRSIIACTGIQFCKLAVAETKTRAEAIVDELERRITIDEPIRISVTGCPNACGQHHICDIGLEGSVTTVDGVKQEAFQVFLGGGVGVREAFGRRAGVRVPSERLADALVSLLEGYRDLRSADETFQDFCLRSDSDTLAGLLRRGIDEPAAVAAAGR